MDWTWLDEVLPDAVVVTDDQQAITVFNHAAERLWGYRAAELLGRPLTLLLPERFGEAHARQVAHFGAEAQEGARRMDRRTAVVGRRRDGAEFPCEVSIARTTVDGRLQFVAIVRDLTARRAAEEQLLQAQKMETVGRLAGGIAHDFNNLLTVVVASASLLHRALNLDSPLMTEVTAIEEASARAAALTRQLLAFGRRQPSDPRAVDVSVVAAALERVLRRVIEGSVELQVRLEPNCFVRIDPTQLEQVLLNLAVNARDAMPRGGALTVSTHLLEHRGEVQIKVADAGAGIEPSVRARLFEPFFTTKGPAKGTGLGLGLATSWAIVNQAGGRIEVTSEPGKGACFALHFPLAPAAAPAPPALSPALEPGGGGVLLLADDEPRVRSVLVRALEAGGYRVLAARSGVEALQLLEHERAPISLLVTDVVMPEMGGPALATAVRERWPSVPVIFMTGYADDARLELQEGEIELIAKPFGPPELLARIRRLINLHAPAPSLH